MFLFVLILILLFLLLFFHTAVITGSQNGLLLWYQTLIPSLLPFLLLTNALSETNAYQSFAAHFHSKNPKPIYELLAILLGNLCGYPIGGKMLNDFVSNGYVSSKKANGILALSSQASPMFLIGYVHAHILKETIPLGVFLFCIYLPVLLALPFLQNHDTSSGCHHFQTGTKKIFICDTFMHAVETMVIIGVYVIIFSILLEIALPLVDNNPSAIVLSFLEITTGLKLLTTLCLPVPIKNGIICALSAFGGVCSAFQIKGVLNYQNASIKKYLLDKLVLSAGTFILVILYQWISN